MKTCLTRFFQTLMVMAFLTALPSIVSQAHAAEYAVIVNSANTTNGEDAKSIVKNIYLKKRTTWPDGTPTETFARPSDHPAQEAFLSDVLGLSQAALDEYWASEKAQTGEAAPRQIGSGRILMRQVARKKGAVGVVKADMAQGDGIKVLFTF